MVLCYYGTGTWTLPCASPRERAVGVWVPVLLEGEDQGGGGQEM